MTALCLWCSSESCFRLQSPWRSECVWACSQVTTRLWPLTIDGFWQLAHYLDVESVYLEKKKKKKKKKKKPWFKMANKLKVTLDINISLIKITTNHLFIQSLRVMKVNWFDVHLLHGWTSLYKVFTWNTITYKATTSIP